MSDNGTFQSGTLATPPVGLVVATDYRPSPAGGSAHYQRMVLDVGPDGTTVPLAWGGTGMPLGTLPGGTLQPLAGSVHVANAISGTVQVHGTAQVLGTVRALPGGTLDGGTFQPLAGSVHIANAITGTVQTHGTSQVLGTVRALPGGTLDGGTFQPLAGSVHIANAITGTVQTHGTSQVLGTVRTLDGATVVATLGTIPGGTIQLHGTSEVLGTVQPLAGSVHLATNLAGGTVVAVGSALHGAAADARPLLVSAFGSSGTQAAVDDGDAVRLWADLNGRLQTFGTATLYGGTFAGGTVQPLAGSVHVANAISGTVQVHGTAQALGTLQPLAGSVHPAAALPGTSHITGTVQPLAGAVTATLGTLPGGTVQTHGTSQVLGTVQVLTPVDVTPAVPAANDYLPIRLTDGAAFYVASSGGATDSAAFTEAVTTVSPIAGISTIQAIGQGSIGALAMTDDRILYVRGAGGTFTGTVQPLAGSVHVANAISGTVQTHGTSQVIGTVQTHGTSQALGTLQPLAGSVHLATNLAGGTVVAVGSALHGAAADTRPLLMAAFGSSGTQAAIDDGDSVRLWADLNGRLQMFGTSVLYGGTFAGGTVQPLAGSVHIANAISGTVQTHGTSQVLGTLQPLAGSVHLANSATLGTLPGGTVAIRPSTALGETFFSTVYTAAAAAVTVIAAPGAGTSVRIFDILVSGSAAGTVKVIDNALGTAIGHLHVAANGGWSFNSSRGVKTKAANRAILFDATAGTWGLMINYVLET